MRSYTLIRRLEGHQSSVVSCDFSPDSALLVTASYDACVIMWDPYTGEQLRTLRYGTRKPVGDRGRWTEQCHRGLLGLRAAFPSSWAWPAPLPHLQRLKRGSGLLGLAPLPALEDWDVACGSPGLTLVLFSPLAATSPCTQRWITAAKSTPAPCAPSASPLRASTWPRWRMTGE